MCKADLNFSLYILAITVMFGQTVYSVIENTGPAQLVLALSNPSSTDITVQVTNTDGSAAGEYIHNYVLTRPVIINCIHCDMKITKFVLS